MRQRTRDYPNARELAAMYARPHDANEWGPGHALRQRATVDLAVTHSGDPWDIDTVADLSCGNGYIAAEIVRWTDIDPAVDPAHGWHRAKLILGDLAAPDPRRTTWPAQFSMVGPIEETIHDLPIVDLFVCSETIEHLDDPDRVLGLIRGHARQLIVSTPIGEAFHPEHVWVWDVDAVEAMLEAADWRPLERVELHLPGTFSYQIWRCT